jgi:hypothetical protein
MTAAELENAHRATERAKVIVAENRDALDDARKREAQLDRALATSQIKSDEYRRVLRRAGLLKP